MHSIAPRSTSREMPSRVPPDNARDEDSSTGSNTPLSDSEKSFVSAASESHSLSKKRNLVDQTTLPQSTNPLSRPPLHHLLSTETSDSSAFSSTAHEATPLPRTQRVSSPGPKEAFQPSSSYFGLQAGASGLEPRSPLYRRAPASRSSHGIGTSSGPPPALITQRSYTGESPWRSPSGKAPLSGSNKGKSNGAFESNLNSFESRTEASIDFHSKAGSASKRSLDSKAPKRFTAGAMEEDQYNTLRALGRDSRAIRSSDGPIRNQEDLFLNLARVGADKESDTMSGVERRRVSTPMAFRSF